MKLLHILSLILVLIGGLNWGLVGLVDVNLVSMLLGSSVITTVIYVLVMISTVYHLLPLINKHLIAE